MDARLVFVEGMIGAGKSTTAERFASRLISRGEDARAYLEFAEDHPIRTKAVDRLRAVHPERVWKPDDVGEDGLALDSRVYAADQWDRLAERCLHGRQTIILESTLLQNSVLPAFVAGAPAGKCREIFTRIERRVASARPLLVYLRPTDIVSAIKRVHRARGEVWAAWNVTSVSAFPWARTRNLSGRNAVVELYREWECVVQELFDQCSFSKLMIDDPQEDWDATLRRICHQARP